MTDLNLADGVEAVPLLAGLVVFAIVTLFAIRPGRRPMRRWYPSRPRRSSGFEHNRGGNIEDVGYQLHAVMAASFRQKKLLNTSEYRVFKIIEEEIVSTRQGFRVFAQTPLGEILESPDPDAFRSINSKRVDILVVDSRGWPVLAVEYQGAGHYQGTAAARDAIKKEALRKAGVGYLEVDESDIEDQIRSRLRHQLRSKANDANAGGSAPAATARAWHRL